jgi:hypothetical protein
MTDGSNWYCKVLGIDVPDLAVAKESPDANYFALLLVVLLERGEPVTLQQAAERFKEAGVAPAKAALQSLKRCRPGRPPLYRDGECYALDPHDDEADLWAFRLGLRPPKVAPLRVVRPDPEPLPSLDSPLRMAHLDEAWRYGIPGNVSALRLAVCVLDVHGKPMPPDKVVSFVRARDQRIILTVESAKYWRRGAAVRVKENGMWELNPDHDALRSARRSVFERIESLRSSADTRTDPSVVAAYLKQDSAKRERHSQKLASMRRVLIHAFPEKEPAVLVLIDVAQHDVKTFAGDQLQTAVGNLRNYDNISAIDVRRLLRTLDFDAGERRLGELGPPQKTMKIGDRGRTLKITTSMLINSSCGIARPFGDAKKMCVYLRDGEMTKLRRRIEADAKALYALYQYGRLHRGVRLCFGGYETHIPAPWVHRDEFSLYELKQRAYEQGVPLQVVVGGAPSWSKPWSRAEFAHVLKGEDGWQLCLVGQTGYVIEDEDVQLARFAMKIHAGT